jgi:hypothetical protein
MLTVSNDQEPVKFRFLPLRIGDDAREFIEPARTPAFGVNDSKFAKLVRSSTSQRFRDY